MHNRTLAQKLALMFGAVFLLVGILGFVPGITTNLYGGLDFAGDGSTAELLGIFQVSVLHNIVHLLFAVGILMAATHAGAVKFLLFGGLAYAAVFLLGVIGAGDWIPVNSADNVLHVVLTGALLGSWARGPQGSGAAPARRDLAAAVDRDRQVEKDVVTRRELCLEPFEQGQGSRRGGEQPPLDLRRRVQHDELLLEGPREAAAPEIPAVELLQEAGGAPLAELAHRLADEQDQLRDDLLAASARRRRRRRSRAAPTGSPARRGRPSPPRPPWWRAPSAPSRAR